MVEELRVLFSLLLLIGVLVLHRIVHRSALFEYFASLRVLLLNLLHEDGADV